MSPAPETIFDFFEVANPQVLLPILKERLPISCLMFNQVMQWKNFKQELKFYTIGTTINSSTWIFSNNIREDFDCSYGISAPLEFATGKEPIPYEIKECISTNKLINWDVLENTIYIHATLPLSNMIVDIAANEMGNLTEVHPCNLYYVEREKALQLEFSYDNPKIELRRLNASRNEGDFILKTWVYTCPGSEKEIPKCIERNASGGLFVNGECVCGVYIPAIGYLSALYTLKEHRNKGYAKLVMNYTFKEYAKDGCIPCLNVERANPGGIRFHESLGMKIATQVNGIFIKKLNVD